MIRKGILEDRCFKVKTTYNDHLPNLSSSLDGVLAVDFNFTFQFHTTPTSPPPQKKRKKVINCTLEVS